MTHNAQTGETAARLVGLCGTKRTAQVVHRRLALASTPGGTAVRQFTAGSGTQEHTTIIQLCAHFHSAFVTQSSPLVE